MTREAVLLQPRTAVLPYPRMMALRLVACLAATAVALCFADIGCLVRFATGIACPGCGMTRAWLAVFRGDFAAAFAYHPLFWVVVPACGLALVGGHREVCGCASSRLLDAVAFVLLVFVLALWVLRLVSPADAGLFFGGVVPAGVPVDIVDVALPFWLA